MFDVSVLKGYRISKSSCKSRIGWAMWGLERASEADSGEKFPQTEREGRERRKGGHKKIGWRENGNSTGLLSVHGITYPGHGMA